MFKIIYIYLFPVCWNGDSNTLMVQYLSSIHILFYDLLTNKMIEKKPKTNNIYKYNMLTFLVSEGETIQN